MRRRTFLKAASVSAAGAVVPNAAERAAAQQPGSGNKPNIIFIVSDQHRAGLTKREGYPLDTSPTLEKLAEGGVGFDRASAAARAHHEGYGFDELNKVTQSGLQKMVRMGDWKLIYDMLGYGQLYHLPSDPGELRNLFGQPQHAEEQARLMSELCMWSIRNEDSLPTGPQNIKYRTKWSRKHNWYAPYPHGVAPESYIP